MPILKSENFDLLVATSELTNQGITNLKRIHELHILHGMFFISSRKPVLIQRCQPLARLFPPLAVHAYQHNDL